MFIIDLEAFSTLFTLLKQNNFTILGPTVRDSVIIYDTLESARDLPIGWTDEQFNGTYLLKKTKDKTYFNYNVGLQSWKKFLLPPRLRLFRAAQDGSRFAITTDDTPPPRYAFLGVRSCELNALTIQDRIFAEGRFQDSYYYHRRRDTFIIAVNCTRAGGTCFCTSMNTGPRAKANFDLALTEVYQPGNHFFILETGSEAGEQIAALLPRRRATSAELESAHSAVDRAARQMGKGIDTTDIKELFYRNLENPVWEEVARRCLSCGNCTLVCPTCFCTTIEDVTDLEGENAERWRRWDSCFSAEFSYIHGGSVRQSVSARYRQWITHKLASWYDQFGSSGCVGCGRCITWCPVGIDITEETARLRQSEKKSPKR